MKKKIIALIMSMILCVSCMTPVMAEDDSGFDISSLLTSDIVQQLLSSGAVIDITNLVMQMVATMNPESLQAMGQEKSQQLIQSMVESISDYLSLITSNKDLVITYDPLKVFGNLFDLDTESLTTQNPENTEPHPDEMEIGMGDVDGDGHILAADARLILRRAADLITFTMEQEKLADVNRDGQITAIDARMVLRVASGLDSIDILY